MSATQTQYRPDAQRGRDTRQPKVWTDAERTSYEVAEDITQDHEVVVGKVRRTQTIREQRGHAVALVRDRQLVLPDAAWHAQLELVKEYATRVEPQLRDRPGLAMAWVGQAVTQAAAQDAVLAVGADGTPEPDAGQLLDLSSQLATYNVTQRGREEAAAREQKQVASAAADVRGLHTEQQRVLQQHRELLEQMSRAKVTHFKLKLLNMAQYASAASAGVTLAGTLMGAASFVIALPLGMVLGTCTVAYKLADSRRDPVTGEMKVTMTRDKRRIAKEIAKVLVLQAFATGIAQAGSFAFSAAQNAGYITKAILFGLDVTWRASAQKVATTGLNLRMPDSASADVMRAMHDPQTVFSRTLRAHIAVQDRQRHMAEMAAHMKKGMSAEDALRYSRGDYWNVGSLDTLQRVSYELQKRFSWTGAIAAVGAVAMLVKPELWPALYSDRLAALEPQTRATLRAHGARALVQLLGLDQRVQKAISRVLNGFGAAYPHKDAHAGRLVPEYVDRTRAAVFQRFMRQDVLRPVLEQAAQGALVAIVQGVFDYPLDAQTTEVLTGATNHTPAAQAKRRVEVPMTREGMKGYVHIMSARPRPPAQQTPRLAEVDDIMADIAQADSLLGTETYTEQVRKSYEQVLSRHRGGTTLHAKDIMGLAEVRARARQGLADHMGQQEHTDSFSTDYTMAFSYLHMSEYAIPRATQDRYRAHAAQLAKTGQAITSPEELHAAFPGTGLAEKAEAFKTYQGGISAKLSQAQAVQRQHQAQGYSVNSGRLVQESQDVIDRFQPLLDGSHSIVKQLEQAVTSPELRDAVDAQAKTAASINHVRLDPLADETLTQLYPQLARETERVARLTVTRQRDEDLLQALRADQFKPAPARIEELHSAELVGVALKRLEAVLSQETDRLREPARATVRMVDSALRAQRVAMSPLVAQQLQLDLGFANVTPLETTPSPLYRRPAGPEFVAPSYDGAIGPEFVAPAYARPAGPRAQEFATLDDDDSDDGYRTVDPPVVPAMPLQLEPPRAEMTTAVALHAPDVYREPELLADDARSTEQSVFQGLRRAEALQRHFDRRPELSRGHVVLVDWATEPGVTPQDLAQQLSLLNLTPVGVTSDGGPYADLQESRDRASRAAQQLLEGGLEATAQLVEVLVDTWQHTAPEVWAWLNDVASVSVSPLMVQQTRRWVPHLPEHEVRALLDGGASPDKVAGLLDVFPAHCGTEKDPANGLTALYATVSSVARARTLRRALADVFSGLEVAAADPCLCPALGWWRCVPEGGLGRKTVGSYEDVLRGLAAQLELWQDESGNRLSPAVVDGFVRQLA